ncbi:CHRD domain-containing protein [Thermoactinomyces sp. DSM 45892]|uniref:CHRD domain-containing protein n=1 Tax=Thermoactinomyces sp. DSM 45892 TaxID=1882753 RepID=UPI00089D6B06|nr:CHRD domain-containing protein [Thermoactinomyces sp. DSM 45892]SDY78099.1 CHRD domain-containing protein [Thermoactinomyces sp. DSM 45892]
MAKNFFAFLTGNQEVPKVITSALGVLTLNSNNDETGIDYTLLVYNMQKLIAAHLHLGPVGQNGPVVVPLASVNPGLSLKQVGIISGVITADDLVGPLAGETIERLIQLIEVGEIYTNVHTENHPSGEIRGQVS